MVFLRKPEETYYVVCLFRFLRKSISLLNSKNWNYEIK